MNKKERQIIKLFEKKIIVSLSNSEISRLTKTSRPFVIKTINKWEQAKKELLK